MLSHCLCKFKKQHLGQLRMDIPLMIASILQRKSSMTVCCDESWRAVLQTNKLEGRLGGSSNSIHMSSRS